MQANSRSREHANMAELTINADEIAAALRTHVEYVLAVAGAGRRSAGSSRSATASPASPACPTPRSTSCSSSRAALLGLALNLDEETRSARWSSARATTSKRARRSRPPAASSRCPSATRSIGRVVNALGQPIDGKGPIASDTQRRLEVQAPGIVGRKPVHEPLQTGIKAIDAMTPDRPRSARAHHRRPQDRQDHRRHRHDPEPEGSGREVHLRRDRPEGRRRSRRPSARSTEHGAMEYTVVVNAPAGDEAVFKYLAPYAGCAMGQHWMDNGEAALVVYDDLSKQAEAYRQIVAAAAAPAGPRGVPRRRLLPAQPPARARREALRRPRRRFAHRAADHRDQGG